MVSSFTHLQTLRRVTLAPVREQSNCGGDSDTEIRFRVAQIRFNFAASSRLDHVSRIVCITGDVEMPRGELKIVILWPKFFVQVFRPSLLSFTRFVVLARHVDYRAQARQDVARARKSPAQTERIRKCGSEFLRHRASGCSPLGASSPRTVEGCVELGATEGEGETKERARLNVFTPPDCPHSRRDLVRQSTVGILPRLQRLLVRLRESLSLRSSSSNVGNPAIPLAPRLRRVVPSSQHSADSLRRLD